MCKKRLDINDYKYFCYILILISKRDSPGLNNKSLLKMSLRKKITRKKCSYWDQFRKNWDTLYQFLMQNIVQNYMNNKNNIYFWTKNDDHLMYFLTIKVVKKHFLHRPLWLQFNRFFIFFFTYGKFTSSPTNFCFIFFDSINPSLLKRRLKFIKITFSTNFKIYGFFLFI